MNFSNLDLKRNWKGKRINRKNGGLSPQDLLDWPSPSSLRQHLGSAHFGIEPLTCGARLSVSAKKGKFPQRGCLCGGSNSRAAETESMCTATALLKRYSIEYATETG